MGSRQKQSKREFQIYTTSLYTVSPIISSTVSHTVCYTVCYVVCYIVCYTICYTVSYTISYIVSYNILYIDQLIIGCFDFVSTLVSTLDS